MTESQTVYIETVQVALHHQSGIKPRFNRPCEVGNRPLFHSVRLARIVTGLRISEEQASIIIAQTDFDIIQQATFDLKPGRCGTCYVPLTYDSSDILGPEQEKFVIR